MATRYDVSREKIKKKKDFLDSFRYFCQQGGRIFKKKERPI